VFELVLTLDDVSAENIIGQLGAAFPAAELARIEGIEDLVAGEVFGGYVRYEYDQFDGFAHPDVPIFSRAYYYEGSSEDFERIIDSLNGLYPEHRYDDSQNANYYRIDGQIVSFGFLETDSEERIVTVSIQQEP
jgi:hypothetical protein